MTRGCGGSTRSLFPSAMFWLLLSFGLLAWQPTQAAVVYSAQLDQSQSTGTLTDPSQIIDVSIDDAGAPAIPWQVTVDGGSNFEEFLFNYDPALTISNVQLTGDSVGLWTLNSSGGTAGSFGSFDFSLNGPIPSGAASLTFDILVAGDFLPNSDGNYFAAKLASEGNSWVSTDTLTAVPLPPAVWIFLSGLTGIAALLARRRKYVPQSS